MSTLQPQRDICNGRETTSTDASPLVKNKKIAYIYNDDYIKSCDQLPKVQNRSSMVHSLICAYGLLGKMRLISPKPASSDDIGLFHSVDYVDYLRKMSDADDDDEKTWDDAELYGLTYDCPAFPGVYEYSCYVVGASVKAAECLLMSLADVAINWPGGWHHSKRDEASGYCYFNDIVVAILKLRKKFDRVLYVDLDLHHGDGVEEAFSATSKVMTVSFHKVSAGFFPGTGTLSDVGIGKGKYYTVNVPLMDGLQDAQFCHVFDRVMKMVQESYQPDAVVCQCGADGLAGDPMESFNLTSAGLVNCVTQLLTWNTPMLLVGGGGYNLANTARCWTEITAALLGKTLNTEIPEHEYFTEYGPDYQLTFTAGNRSNKNIQEHIEVIVNKISGLYPMNIENLEDKAYIAKRKDS